MIPPLELQPEHLPSDAEVYQLHELVRYHDRAFIRYAYAALTKRAPTPEELARELDDLRSGRRDKVDIIEGLLYGGEHPPTVRVVGLRGGVWRRASRWPVVGYAWRFLRGLASVPLQLKHQQRFEAYLLGQQQKIEDHVNGVIAPALADSIDGVLMLSESLQNHILSLEQSLASLAARQEQHQHQLEAINVQQSQLEATNNAHRQELDERLNAQQELIVQEQQVIVETQKVVMEQLRAEISALATAYEQQSAQLLDQLRRLQATVEAARE
jgi:hypothetical protein